MVEIRRGALRLLVSFLLVSALGAGVARAERLCDPSHENCREVLLDLIRNEMVGIDVAFWFMEDTRYVNELVKKHNEGVPVRILVDPRANGTYPLNASRLAELDAAGIPMRKRVASGILHWKMMLFDGQNTVEFSAANYSVWALNPVDPYQNYTDEAIYFATDPAIVNSFRTQYDSLWTDTTRYADYANVNGPLVARYDSFPKDPELNFVPHESYRNRAVARYDAEIEGIDVTMFRITDRAHTDAMIRAIERGVPVRLYTEPDQYRDRTRYWHSWNVDRLYVAGAEIRHRAHAGSNHQKSVLLHSQAMTIFGSSNWTSASTNSQEEHNYFTVKSWFYDWFVAQFERKWNNTAGFIETEPFVPLPPGTPQYLGPADTAIGLPTTGNVLRWLGGYWAHKYDVFFGTAPDPPLLAADQMLGPSTGSADAKEFALPDLDPGTTYYWRIVSKTMADMASEGDVRSFTTEGDAPPPLPPPPNGTPGEGDIVLHAAEDPVLHGGWTTAADATAAGAARLVHPNAGAAKLSRALADPTHHVEVSFNAEAATPYRLWLRLRAQDDYWGNDSVFVQFSGSVDASGAPVWRIGTTSSTTVNLEDCSGCGLSGWGWQDNGWGTGVLGPLVRFESAGPQTMRIQTREDGVSIDQILLSPSAYLSDAPGALTNDATIYPATGGAPPPAGVRALRQPYLQQVTSTGAIVAWTTAEPGPAAVRVTTPGGASVVAATSTLFPAAATGLAADYYQHVASISGLSPSTTYAYATEVGGVDVINGAAALTTAPDPGDGAVTFVAFGDSGTGSTEQRTLASLLAADSFDFAMHAGDVAYGTAEGLGGATHGTLDAWFFDIYRGWLGERPMFPSIGNHDSRASNADGRPYLDAFVLPEDGATTEYPDHAERYYSFDYGPVHVVVLDTELAFQDTARRSAQLAWLDADLSTTTQPWKVALFHRSPYSAGGEHGSDLVVRDAFGPLFEAHGVQLVLSAHEHIYHRSVAIGGVTYIVTGGGGGPLYPALTEPWTAASFARHHYVHGTADACTLSLEAIGLDGSAFDTVTLTQCAAPPDTEPPVPSITEPAAGAAVAGNVTVRVSATDNVGVTRVELLVDGVPQAEDTTAPYEFLWSSTVAANGAHTLTARAYDAAGNTGSASVDVTVDNTTTDPGDIVLYASEASVVSGGWRIQADAGAAGGALMRHPDGGAAKRSAPLANPLDYFELTFQAEAGLPYHLWMRSRADGDHWANDSVFVQFSNVSGAAIGSSEAETVNLEDCSGCGIAGWGWQDNGWGVGVAGPHIVFATAGLQTIRVQTREDGLSIDQIVLSAARFITDAPGALKRDSTIYPKAGGAAPPPDTTPPVVSIASPAPGSTVGGAVVVAVDATDNVRVAEVELWVDGTLTASRTAAPFTFTWDASAAGDGAHILEARAQDTSGNVATSPAVDVTVDSTAAGAGEIILYASNATVTAGGWQVVADSSAAGGWAMYQADAGAAKRSTALAEPLDYFELTFTAEAGVPYHLWMRARAEGDYWGNDSVHVQFSGSPDYAIGTSSAATVNLEDCSGCGLSGWGWQDNGWGVGVNGAHIEFATGGTQTIRIQTREDGLKIDQIVLSPAAFLTDPPGTLKNDTTILAPSN